MRISTTQQYNNLLQGIAKQQEVVASRGEQISADKRFSRPSQAGFEYKTSLDFRHAQKGVEGSLTAIGIADSRLAASETILNGMSNVLVRAQTLAVQANSAQLGVQERNAISIEITHLLGQLFSDANQSWQGQALFAGTAVDGDAFSTAFSAGSALHTPGVNTSINVSQTSNVNAVNDTYTITLNAGGTQIDSVTDSLGVNQLVAPPAVLGLGANVLNLTNGTVLNATYSGTPQGNTDGGSLAVSNANVAGNYDYIGNDQDRVVAISSTLTTKSNVRGDDPSFLQALQSLQGFATALQNNDVAAIGVSLDGLTQSGQKIVELTSDVGARMSSLDASKVSNEDMRYTLDRSINNHESVNMAEAMAQITQSNVVLQASYNLISRLESLSLVNFLR
ncbi:MAG: flagellar hook-associated protein FlgL [Mariprofundaceae bacterium]